MLLIFLFHFALCCLLCMPVLSLEAVSIDDVVLNRVGSVLPSDTLHSSGFKNAEFGFTWNNEDNDSIKWRPQGISSFSINSKDYIIVSWYGREQENYENRGVRIALVDISGTKGTTSTTTSSNSSATSEVKYRQILLIDENDHTFEGMHGGGLAFSNDEESIHVPDSRSGTKQIYTFPISNILYVTETERTDYYNYEYVIKRQSSYGVPITPSFISYDWGLNKFLVGTFWQCSSSHMDSSECLSSDNNRLSWYDKDSVGVSTPPSCAPFFSELQGAAAATVSIPGSYKSSSSSSSRILWTSCSYGSSHTSHLHVSDITTLDCSAGDNQWDNEFYRTIEYPPGLEDLHITAPADAADADTQQQFLWGLTEFGTGDGKDNHRTVFMTNIEYIMP